MFLKNSLVIRIKKNKKTVKSDGEKQSKILKRTKMIK